MEDYYTVQTPEHHSRIMQELHTLQKQGVGCDVVLAAEDGEVMAHKVVLMAASKYFREKLPQTVSKNNCRVYLKNISVVELANLVKYIYTGKLLVAKETMDVTLEVSEILELNGVIRGYREITAYEEMKCGSDLDMHASSAPISGQDVHMSSTAGTSQYTAQVSSATTQNLVPVVDSSAVTGEPQAQPHQDIHVTEYREDGSSVTYTIEQAENADSNANQGTANEYSFEFNPYEEQYMDVSVGTSVGQATPPVPPLTKMGPPISEEQRAVDEQAQHQDLLSVAIEKLTGDSTMLESQMKQQETELAVSSIVSEEVTCDSTQPESYVIEGAADGKFVNGKVVDTKIVTLDAGIVSNERGGKTSVYTVALDPATIKRPLKMPRQNRKKTEKEKEAERVAEMYRQKRRELRKQPYMPYPSLENLPNEMKPATPKEEPSAVPQNNPDSKKTKSAKQPSFTTKSKKVSGESPKKQTTPRVNLRETRSSPRKASQVPKSPEKNAVVNTPAETQPIEFKKGRNLLAAMEKETAKTDESETNIHQNLSTDSKKNAGKTPDKPIEPSDKKVATGKIATKTQIVYETSEDFGQVVNFDSDEDENISPVTDIVTDGVNQKKKGDKLKGPKSKGKKLEKTPAIHDGSKGTTLRAEQEIKSPICKQNGGKVVNYEKPNVDPVKISVPRVIKPNDMPLVPLESSAVQHSDNSTAVSKKGANKKAVNPSELSEKTTAVSTVASNEKTNNKNQATDKSSGRTSLGKSSKPKEPEKELNAEVKDRSVPLATTSTVDSISQKLRSTGTLKTPSDSSAANNKEKNVKTAEKSNSNESDKETSKLDARSGKTAGLKKQSDVKQQEKNTLKSEVELLHNAEDKVSSVQKSGKIIREKSSQDNKAVAGTSASTTAAASDKQKSGKNMPKENSESSTKESLPEANDNEKTIESDEGTAVKQVTDAVDNDLSNISHLDLAAHDTARSSATKRKGKIPRRLPSTATYRFCSNGNSIPIVRSRKNSRNEGSHANGTSQRSPKIDGESGKVIVFADEGENQDVAEKSPLMKAPSSLPVGNAKTSVKQHANVPETGRKIVVGKHMLPEVRLKKFTEEDILAFAKNISSTQEIDEEEEETDTEFADIFGGTMDENEMTDNEIITDNENETITDNNALESDHPVIHDNIKVGSSRKAIKRKAQGPVSSPSDDKARGKKAKISGFQCGCCNKGFKSLNLVAKHMKTCSMREEYLLQHSPGVGEFQPAPGSPSKRKVTQSHEQDDGSSAKKQPKMNYICPEDNCQYLSEKLGSISRHLVMFHHKVGTNLSCKQVPATADVPSTSDGRGGEEASKLLTCKCCGNIFGSKTILELHIWKKARSVKDCEFCKKKFVSNVACLNHKIQEHGITIPSSVRRFECSVCDFIGFSYKQIDAHYKEHEDEQIPCMECAETFPTVGELTKHMVIHNKKGNRKSFACKECDFVTTTKLSLTSHRKMKHKTTPGPVMCQFCEYKTTFAGNYRKHMLAAHDITVVTKKNRPLNGNHPTGTMLTQDGNVFDPDKDPLPKMNIRRQDEPQAENGSRRFSRKTKVGLSKLPLEQFTMEVLKRHEAYCQKPHKPKKFMSRNLAIATAHPSFPQASPNVRGTKANKLYNTERVVTRFEDITSYVTGVSATSPEKSGVPIVGNEVEVDAGTVGNNEVVAVQEQDPDAGHMVVIDGAGRKQVVKSTDFYSSVANRSIEVITTLLEAGQQIDKEVDVQNE